MLQIHEHFALTFFFTSIFVYCKINIDIVIRGREWFLLIRFVTKDLSVTFFNGQAKPIELSMDVTIKQISSYWTIIGTSWFSVQYWYLYFVAFWYSIIWTNFYFLLLMNHLYFQRNERSTVMHVHNNFMMTVQNK